MAGRAILGAIGPKPAGIHFLEPHELVDLHTFGEAQEVRVFQIKQGASVQDTELPIGSGAGKQVVSRASLEVISAWGRWEALVAAVIPTIWTSQGSWDGTADDILLRDKSTLEMCRELLHARRGLLRAHEVLALERQLSALLSDEDEIVANGLKVSSASLDGLIAFLAAHRPHTHPRLSLTRGGLFAASWAPRDRVKLTLTFNREAADWVGVDLGAAPPVRDSGAVVIGSLDGMRQSFRDWIVG
jgi:hypothetical protein